MTKSSRQSVTEDIDLASLGGALWRAKRWIIGLAIGAGVITFVGLSMVRPLYTSESRILIQNDESAFTRPANDQGREQQRALDEQAVQSQVQVITSRDLAVQVINALDLTNNAKFAEDGGATIFRRFINWLGLGLGTPESREEKAANTFADHVGVFALGKSSVIGIEYISGDSQLAADIANKLSDVYLEWQRNAKVEQTKDATTWLRTQIDVLRQRVSESEVAAEQFRASEGLYEGSNNATLNAQQLSELNSQVILAKAQRSEAEARARLIKKMLADKGDIDATPEVLKSELISRLTEQRAQVGRQLAELSATLLPSHPRIKQLNSELADIREQIRQEANKIVKSLENESEVAKARETSLRNSLNEVKTQASGLTDAEIKLRALEREAKANRDLLESYLARYQDASARHDMGAAPAQATIVSRAHASILPSFPKKAQLTLLVMAATALLALAFVLARELIGEPSRQPGRSHEPRERRRRERYVSEPAPARGAASAPASSQPTAFPAGGTAEATARELRARLEALAAEPPAATAAPRFKLPVVVPEPPNETSAPNEAPTPTPAASSQPAPPNAMQSTPPAADMKPLKPSWLSPLLAKQAADVGGDHALSVKFEREKDSPVENELPIDAGLLGRWRAKPSAPAEPQSSKDSAAASAKALLDRLRGTPLPAKVEPAQEKAASSAKSFLDRLRGKPSSSDAELPEEASPSSRSLLDRLRGASAAASVEPAAPINGDRPAPLKPGTPSSNDLRDYLAQRIAVASQQPAQKTSSTRSNVASQKSSTRKYDAVLKSFHAVLNQVLAVAKGSAPRAVLVSGVAAKTDAANAAIKLARTLAKRRERVVLVDLTRGAEVVSGPLGLPRAPGFTDLIAGSSTFADVVRVDEETPLQIIVAGNPKLSSAGDVPARFTRLFEALIEVYDCVVLHADRDMVRKLATALKFELPVMIAVLRRGENYESVADEVGEFSKFGCPVLLYEPGGRERRAGLLGRVAAI